MWSEYIDTFTRLTCRDCGKIQLAEIPAVISPYIIQVAGALLSASIPSRVCVCVCVPPKRNQSMRGGRFVSWWERPKRIRNKNKKKRETTTTKWERQKRRLVCVCERALYTGDNVVDESIGASTTGKLWQTREKEVQPACVVFLLFVSFFFPVSVPLAVLLCGCWWMVGCPAADGYLSFPPECMCVV